MSEPIKIGIVGLGRAGNGMHLWAFDKKPDKFKVVAACDLLEERRKDAAEKLGCRTYASIEELIADPEVELVDIATRSCDHYRHARMALDAGKDVFLEKPICLTRTDAADLFRRSNKPGKPRFFPQQNRRFEGAFQEIWKTIRSGKLGNVFEVTISQLGYERRNDWQTLTEFGGGQLLNWGPHIIDQSLRLLESPVKYQFSDRVQGVAGGDCEDHFSVHFIGENGRKVNMCISGVCALTQGRHYVAYGTRGAIEAAGNHIHVQYIDPAQQLPAVVSSPDTPGDSYAFGSTGTFKAAVTPNWMEEEYDVTEDLLTIWDCLYDSYRNGQPYPIKEEEVLALMGAVDRIRADAAIAPFNK